MFFDCIHMLYFFTTAHATIYDTKTNYRGTFNFYLTSTREGIVKMWIFFYLWMRALLLLSHSSCAKATHVNVYVQCGSIL